MTEATNGRGSKTTVDKDIEVSISKCQSAWPVPARAMNGRGSKTETASAQRTTAGHLVEGTRPATACSPKPTEEAARLRPNPEDVPGTTLHPLHSRPDPTAGTRLVPSGEDSEVNGKCKDTGGTPPDRAAENYRAILRLAMKGYEYFHKLPQDCST